MLASRWMLIAAVTGLLGGCSLSDPLPSRESIASSRLYADALAEATRRGETKVGFDIESNLAATLVTPTFHQALQKEFDRVYGGSFTAPELASENLLVVVGLGSTNRDLLRGGAYGRLYQFAFQPRDAHGKASPFEVEPVRMAPFPREGTFFRTFFPYWNPWTQMSIVEFPLPASTTAGTLHMRGVAGELQLTW